jgi:hypothetical protein
MQDTHHFVRGSNSQNSIKIKIEELTSCGLIIFVSGSSRDSLQCAKYPAIRGIANKTGKNSVGNPIALINENLVLTNQLCTQTKFKISTSKSSEIDDI